VYVSGGKKLEIGNGRARVLFGGRQYGRVTVAVMKEEEEKEEEQATAARSVPSGRQLNARTVDGERARVGGTSFSPFVSAVGSACLRVYTYTVFARAFPGARNRRRLYAGRAAQTKVARARSSIFPRSARRARRYVHGEGKYETAESYSRMNHRRCYANAATK